MIIAKKRAVESQELITISTPTRKSEKHNWKINIEHIIKINYPESLIDTFNLYFLPENLMKTSAKKQITQHHSRAEPTSQ